MATGFPSPGPHRPPRIPAVRQTQQDETGIFLLATEYRHLIEISTRYANLCDNLIAGGLSAYALYVLSETRPQPGLPLPVIPVPGAPQQGIPAPNPQPSARLPRQQPINGHQNGLGESAGSQPDSTGEGGPVRQPSSGSFVSAESRAEGLSASSGHRALPNEDRTILLSNLPEGTTHLEVANMVRGGQVLDIFLKPQQKTAAVSFVHEADAKAYLSHVRKYDMYIKQKRVDVSWGFRQVALTNYMANRISSGATRNLVIRGYGPNHTEKGIRNDLDHIHNLIVLSVEFTQGDCYISLNSIIPATFAHSCLRSQKNYKGFRIEYGADECCQPLDQLPIDVRASNATTAVAKEVGIATTNRFDLLQFSDDDDEVEEISDFQ